MHRYHSTVRHTDIDFSNYTVPLLDDEFDSEDEDSLEQDESYLPQLKHAVEDDEDEHACDFWIKENPEVLIS